MKFIVSQTEIPSIVHEMSLLFGQLENSHSGESLLKSHNFHKIIVYTMNKWCTKSYMITASCIYILACMAKCDAKTRQIFINESMLQEINQELFLLYDNKSLNGYVMEVWENASYFLANMTLKSNDQFRFNASDKFIVVHLLLQIFNKGQQYLFAINNYEIKQLNNTKYQLKQKVIDIIFINVLSAFARIFQFHPNISKYLMAKLLSTTDENNDNVLKLIIKQFICYEYNDNVQRHALDVCNCIISTAQKKYIEKLFLDYKLLYFTIDTNHADLLLNLLTNLFDCGYYNLNQIVMRQDEIIEMICNGLENIHSEICIKAIHVFNKILDSYDHNIIKMLCEYQEGKCVIAFCRFLFNYKWCQQNLLIVLNIIRNITMLCNTGTLNTNEIVSILNEFNFCNNLQKLQLLNQTFLERMNLDYFKSFISYLTTKCDKYSGQNLEFVQHEIDGWVSRIFEFTDEQDHDE